MASYNKFHNNCFRLVVTTGETGLCGHLLSPQFGYTEGTGSLSIFYIFSFHYSGRRFVK